MKQALTILFVCFSFLCCDAKKPTQNVPRDVYVSYGQEIMATFIEVSLPAGSHSQDDAETVFDIFRQVDAQMSEWKETSPLSAVNRAAGKSAVNVPKDLIKLIQKSIEIGNLTDGAFDITWAALWDVWDFRALQPKLPDARLVQERIALIDARRIRIDDQKGTIELPLAGMKIGLGGIAKGYALDLAVAALRKKGIESFMISAGGQVFVGGMKGNRPWRVGIRDPRGSAQDDFAMMELSNVSVSTSGDYERFFMIDGIRYHHIIDPRTGFPARGLRSVSVVSPDATLADALSTAMMVMGLEKSMLLAEKMEGVDVLIVDDLPQMYLSRGLQDRVLIRHSLK